VNKNLLALPFFILLILFLSFGCQTTPDIKQSPLPGDPVANFPQMAVGESWMISEYSQKFNRDVHHNKVIQVQSDGSFLLEVRGEKEGLSYRKYDNKYERVREKSSSKPLDFPLFIGKKWKVEYFDYSTSGKYARYVDEHVVEKYEIVNTEAGSFKSFKIKRSQHNIDRNWRGSEEYWYSPEVKCIVKSVPSWRYGLELISYTPATAKPIETEKPKIIITGEKVKIAIMEFHGLNQEAQNDNLGKIFTEMLTTSFVKSDAFKIIEREQLRKLLEELQLNQSGIIDTTNAKQIGKMVGADAIVIGNIIKIGNDMRLDARIIDVETGIILTGEKSEGKVDLKSIGLMAESIVADLAHRFYKGKK
jgi:TolB-like protein